MKIFVLRHGEAERSYPDSERCLTGDGKLEIEALASSLRNRADFTPKVLWVSPLRRARETAETLVDSMEISLDEKETVDALAPDSNPSMLIDRISELTSSILIVGHNPNLSSLVSILISGEQGRSRIWLKTGAMVALKWNPIPNFGQVGPAELAWMYSRS